MTTTPPIEMCAVFFLKDGSVLVEGTDYEPTGPGGMTSKIRARLSAESLNGLLGQVVLDVLSQTQVIDAKLYDSKSIMAGRWTLTGLRSHRALESSSRLLEVSRKGTDVTVIPTESRAFAEGGYAHLPQLKGTCQSSPDAVRDLLLAKVEECR